MACDLIVFLVLITLFFGNSHSQRSSKFFRKDYHYIEDTQSFYKVHKDSKTWLNAKKTCELEGASLYYPEDDFEANTVIKFWNETESENVFEWIYIGISSRYAKNAFETIDGISIIDLPIKWAPWEPNNSTGLDDCVVYFKNKNTIYDENCDKKQLFICKKTLGSVEWNEKCAIPDASYIYNDTLGKCYKFHHTPMTWSEAYAVCYNEQAYLAIVNSEYEADYFKQLIEEISEKMLLKRSITGFTYLGFHNIDRDGWKTVKDNALQDLGYQRWSYSLRDSSSKMCGVIAKDGILNGIPCSYKNFFICERESLSYIDERLAGF